MTATAPDRTDVHSRITNRILTDLERGVRPWMKPWDTGHAAGRIVRPRRASGQPYRGINTVMLWMTALERGYAAPVWLSYRQARALGGQVRRGEHGTLVVYAGTVTRSEPGDDGEKSEREIHFLKGYTVFNAEQVDGLPDRFRAPVPEPREPMQRIAAADRFFAATGAEIHVLDRGLDAIAAERAKTGRLEATIARIDDLLITVVAVLNLVHDLDPAAVAETKAAVHEQLGHPRRPPPGVRDGFHPTDIGKEGTT